MVVYKFTMSAGYCNYSCDLTTATDRSTSMTSDCLFKDFTCNRYGREMPNKPFVASAVTSLGFSASVFKGGKAIDGKTGGDFEMLIEGLELI